MGSNVCDDNSWPFVQLESAGWFPQRDDGKSQSWVVMILPFWDGDGWELLFSSVGLVNIKLKLLNTL